MSYYLIYARNYLWEFGVIFWSRAMQFADAELQYLQHETSQIGTVFKVSKLEPSV